jgi:hypothetical protein
MRHDYLRMVNTKAFVVLPQIMVSCFTFVLLDAKARLNEWVDTPLSNTSINRFVAIPKAKDMQIYAQMN